MKQSRILREVNETLAALWRARALHKTPSPRHPGEVLKDTVLRTGGGVTIAQFAKRLRVSRVTLSRVVNGKAAVSAELAIRLAAALRGSAESWLRMQLAYDLWHAQRKRLPNIEPLSHSENPGRAVDISTRRRVAEADR